MARTRIRTVKPELFRHKKLFDLEVETGLPIRTAWMGLFTAADREGRFRWEPHELKLDILPYDAADFSQVLDALASRGFIVKYRKEIRNDFFNEIREYGWIPTFKEHQVINPREGVSHLPDPHKDCEIVHLYGLPVKPQNTARPRVITRHDPVTDALEEEIRSEELKTEKSAERQLSAPIKPSQSFLPFVQEVGADEIPPSFEANAPEIPVVTENSELSIDPFHSNSRVIHASSTRQNPAHGEMEVEMEGELEMEMEVTEGSPSATRDQPLSTQLIWKAYSEAYLSRYEHEPIRNAKINSQIKQFVSRLPTKDAPDVVRFFVQHNNRYYVQKMHPVGLLLQDAEKLYTEWRRGRPMTIAEATSGEGMDHYRSQMQRLTGSPE